MTQGSPEELQGQVWRGAKTDTSLPASHANLRCSEFALLSTNVSAFEKKQNDGHALKRRSWARTAGLGLAVPASRMWCGLPCHKASNVPHYVVGVVVYGHSSRAPATSNIFASDNREIWNEQSSLLLVCLSASGQTLDSLGECKALLQPLALHFRQQTSSDYIFQATIGQGLS